MLVIIFGLIYLCVDIALNKFAFSSGWTILWPLNGITIAILLRRRRRDWIPIMLGVALGTGFGEFLDDNPIVSTILQRLFSVEEVVLSALLLPYFVSLDKWLRTPYIFLRFVAALVLGPAVSGVCAAILFHQTQNIPYLIGFNNWATADALGIAALLPLALAGRSVEMQDLFRTGTLQRTITVILLGLGVSGIVFSVSRYPLLFLLYPALLLVDSLLAFPGAALVVAATCFIAVYCTTHGLGPFGTWPTDLFVSRDVALQVYLGFHIVALFPASLLFMERRRMAEKLRESNAQLLALAAVDGLTSIPNRRSLDDRFDSEWRRAIRSQKSIALLMIDIDHFKQFNDLYGHHAGDQCLQTVAATLAGSIRREADFVARYGGEEFALLLPLTDIEGAILFAEEVRTAVADLAIAHQGSPHALVTVSIGCSACRLAPGQMNLNPIHLLKAADAALYRAKQNGRNRIESEPAESSLGLADKPGSRSDKRGH